MFVLHIIHIFTAPEEPVARLPGNKIHSFTHSIHVHLFTHSETYRPLFIHPHFFVSFPLRSESKLKSSTSLTLVLTAVLAAHTHAYMA